MRQVYLAGPITGLTYDESTDWRQDVAERLSKFDISALSPLRGKSYLGRMGKLETMGYEGWPLSTPKGITTRDRWDCQRADAVLANLLGADRVSIGTVMECAWADAVRVPLVVVMEEGNLHDHAMIREVAGFIAPTLEQAVDVVIALLEAN